MFKRIGLVCLAGFVVLATTVYAVSSERQKKLEQERLKAGKETRVVIPREQKLEQERLKAGVITPTLKAYSATKTPEVINISKSAPHGVKKVHPARPIVSKDVLLTEGFEGDWPPAGWVVYDGLGTTHWEQECYTYAHSGLCGAYVSWGYDLDEVLESPPLDFSDFKGPIVLKFWWESSYYWHVDPYDNGDLFVYVYDAIADEEYILWTFGEEEDVVNSGGPWPWTNWTWYEATIDLSDFSGCEEIYVAWRVVADDNADIAIDDVEISTISGYDVGVSSIDVPSGALDPGVPLTPEVTVQNLASAATFDLFMEIYEGDKQLVYSGSASEQYLDALASGSFELSPDWTPSSEPGVNYDVYAWTYLSGDENPDNDTLIGSAFIPGEICEGDTIHYDNPATEADDAIGLTSGGTFEGAIRMTPDQLAPFATGSIYSVMFYHYVSEGTSESHSGNIKIYDEGTTAAPGDLLASVPYEATGMGWHEVLMPTKVDISGSSDLWASVEITHAAGEYPIAVDGDGATQGYGDWIYAEGLGWDELYLLELDYDWDIRVYACYGAGEYIDAAVTDVAEPADQSIYLVGAVIYPEATVKNNSTEPQTFDVTCEIDMYTKAYQDIQTVNNLAPGTEETVYFTSWEATLPGPYYACVYTSLEGDQNPNNDEICNDFGVATYLEDFEDDEGGYTPECAWEWGVPDYIYGPESAYSGDNCWGTVLDYDYPLDANCKLYSRLFEATSDYPGFGFFHWYDTEGTYSCYDGGNLKITVNGGDPVIVETVLPYYNGVASSGNEGIPGEPCWFGHDQQYWEGVAVDLSPYVTTDDQFQLIWHFGSDYSLSYAGWYIDYVAGYGFATITFIDVGVVDILAPVGFYTVGSMVTPTAIIKNYGDTEETFDVCCWIGLDKKNKDNGDYEECLEVTLEPGEEDTLEFPEWEATEEGFYYCNVWTDLEDMNPDNDSIYSEFTVVSYVQDFETSGGGFASYECWEWGVPEYGPETAYSGDNCWGTVLDDSYPDDANCRLMSMPFDVTSEYPVFFFVHWFETESPYTAWDGGNLKITVNGDAPVIVETVLPYYNGVAHTANAAIPGEPCWFGDQLYWDAVTVDLSDYVTTGDEFQLIWHFGADDYGTADAGWYIDDVAGAGFVPGAIDHDVQAIEIGFPEIIDTLIKLHAYTIAGIVRNNSPATEESFRAHLKIIKDGKLDYSAFVTVTDLPPRAVDTVYFSPDWVPRQIGDYTAELILSFDPDRPDHDPLPGNNVKSKSLWVVDIGGPPSLPIIPKVFFLNQNAPNPMADRTIIEFGLPKETSVKLSIYSSTGRLIKVIENETKVPGYYRIDWDGKDATGREVGSGVYFYKLEAGNYKSTKKLTLIR